MGMSDVLNPVVLSSVPILIALIGAIALLFPMKIGSADFHFYMPVPKGSLAFG